jgi:hypothetical protein
MTWTSQKPALNAHISSPEPETVHKSVLTRPIEWERPSCCGGACRPTGRAGSWNVLRDHAGARRSTSTLWSPPRTSNRLALFLAQNSKHRSSLGYPIGFSHVFAFAGSDGVGLFSPCRTPTTPTSILPRRCPLQERGTPGDLRGRLADTMSGRAEGPKTARRRWSARNTIVFGRSVLLRMSRDSNRLKYPTFPFFHSQVTSSANTTIR